MILADVIPSERIRLPVHAGDPPAVFEIVADFLRWYSGRIERDVDKLAADCRTREELEAVAAGYVGAIGNNIPDQTIRAAVKRCARVKFQVARKPWA